MSPPRIELLPGTLDMLVLRSLVGGPQHGYAIVRRLQSSSAGVLQVEEGSLYPALHRMERRRWVRSEWGQSEAGRRAKFYRLTPAGRRELEERTQSWEQMSTAIGMVLRAEA
jgi:transcriptional regulator